MEIRDYYKRQLSQLETPEFVAWFENWYGDDSLFPPEGGPLLEGYWSERRFALLGYFAASLPATVSSDKFAFVRAMREKA